MAGTLFVVATPIGNLEDMTFRAVRVLREAAVVAAEDTRHSGRLLRHFDIGTKLLSLHQHNEELRVASILGILARGESVALVSDAGTPAVSDPGARLVAAAVQAGFTVEPVPGASAVVAAVSVSGISDGGFAFTGFPPFKSKDRNDWFTALCRLRKDVAVVFFEAPHRIEKTLAELNVLVNDQIIVCRELTKLHETIYRGRPAEVLSRLLPAIGEFTVVIPRSISPIVGEIRPSDDDVRLMFGQITAKSGRAAAKLVAKATGLAANEVYDIVNRRKT